MCLILAMAGIEHAALGFWVLPDNLTTRQHACITRKFFQIRDVVH